MAQAVPLPDAAPADRKRVKVYELRRGDWFDRGTGFCIAVPGEDGRDEPKIIVEAEDAPSRILLTTHITKSEQFSKQQDTLIVWSEPRTEPLPDPTNDQDKLMMDMALSFQEADGCAAIWEFLNDMQNRLQTFSGPDDALSDDMSHNDSFHHSTLSLPNPQLGNLKDIETDMRGLSNTPNGRESLTKFILNADYIAKLIPLVEMAEDLEDLPSLHRLCNIMKSMILLNDSSLIEYAMTDEVILGVVGALEYDPDFPSHKANHRLWLGDESRYREVVKIDDEQIRKKIHHTYRLQYLKDVVLARILDDPTFSILNSLIFFNQVDIVQHLQGNAVFLKELFGIFGPLEEDQKRKKDAVLFIQQCCVIAKALQPQGRQQLYNNFLSHGLLHVINFALRHKDVGVRVGATDIMVAMIDHDPQMIRSTLFRQINDKQVPLTDSLIDLLLVEVDLGVKAQIADAIKVLLDPGPQISPAQGIAKEGGQFDNRVRPHADAQQEAFLVNFYEESAVKLFKPLIDLKGRENMDFTVQQTSLFVHLIEILCFFIRQHGYRSKHFVLSQLLGQRVAQLLRSNEKFLKLTAVKFFRNLIAPSDEFYNQQMMQEKLFLPILSIIQSTSTTPPRDNLLNSAVLEFFDFIRRENVKPVITHIVENYRTQLQEIKYVDTFQQMIQRYDNGFQNQEQTMRQGTEETTPQSTRQQNRFGGGLRDLDEREEDYFNTSDDEDEVPRLSVSGDGRASINGGASPLKPLVDYGSDEEDDSPQANTTPSKAAKNTSAVDGEASHAGASPLSATSTPPERLSEKRRREADEDDDAFGKLSHQSGSASKRRTSAGSTSSNGSLSNSSGGAPFLRKRKAFGTASKDNATSVVSGTPTRKISISIGGGGAAAIKSGGGGEGDGKN